MKAVSLISGVRAINLGIGSEHRDKNYVDLTSLNCSLFYFSTIWVEICVNDQLKYLL